MGTIGSINGHHVHNFSSNLMNEIYLLVVYREGNLCIGDEIINVNGRRLRGLTMAGARDALGSGPRDVDLVIARPQLWENSTQLQQASQPKSTMPESSVDYENILILPPTADTSTDEHNDYEEIEFKCASPASKVIRKRQHFQKNSKMVQHATASYAAVSQDTEMDIITGAYIRFMFVNNQIVTWRMVGSQTLGS